MIIKKGNPFPLGVTKTACGVQFAFAGSRDKTWKLKIYNQDGELVHLVDLDDNYRTYDVLSCIIEDEGLLTKQIDSYEYIYEADNTEVIDPYAARVCGRDVFGKKTYNVRGGIHLTDYDWEDDKKPGYTFDEMIIYMLHVRGFTKKAALGSSRKKGTYEGIIEKIPYLTELGINCVLLLPAYDFDEEIKSPDAFGIPTGIKGPVNPDRLYADDREMKINYWGYTGHASYFAPKASYAQRPSDCVNSFKNMVKALHKAGIEVIMDIHFKENEDCRFMLDCLKHWAYNYHIDGFKVNCNVIPQELIKRDTILSSIKFITTYWDRNNISNRFADYNDGDMINIRRLILSEEGQCFEYAQRFLYDTGRVGSVSYVANINSFTLMDMVSYERKHNEQNGENNSDGTDYNYSANYGEEGVTKKKKINKIRLAQMKNALTLLFLSYKTPMLLAGDEFGNSQRGNNNPYCQDNEVSYVDWKALVRNKELNGFVKELIRLRKEIIKNGKEVTFHGLFPWKADYSPGNRSLGIMIGSGETYIAINMNKKGAQFCLPSCKKGKVWKSVLFTKDEPVVSFKDGMCVSILPEVSIAIFRNS